MKRIIYILPVLLLLLTGCGASAENNTYKMQEVEKPQIGLSFDSFVIERWQRDRDVFVSVAKELGAEVNVQNANGNIDEQKRQIEYFIKKNVDAIVVIGIDSKELNEVVAKAKNAGIKVIAYDRLLENSDADLYISFDNEMVGTMMGEAIASCNLPNRKVVMLGGATSDHNVVMVENGFMEKMKENNIDIIDLFHADGWRAELAAEHALENMSIIKEADAIMCGNDNLASQIVPVLAQNRLAGQIRVVGQDADLEACQRIVEGTQLMTVYKPVEKLARRAAQCTMKLIKGESIEGEDVTIINDGTYDIPYVRLSPVSVTKDNIDDVIIGSGFHLQEDVYLNVH